MKKFVTTLAMLYMVSVIAMAADVVPADEKQISPSVSQPVSVNAENSTEVNNTESNQEINTENSNAVTLDVSGEDIRPDSEFAKDTESQILFIVEPYIELRTGPGAGYPIFHVAEKGKSIQVLTRKTDWFKVRTPTDITGWVARSQLEKTLTQAGVKKSFQDILLDDYLKSRLEFGISGGLFENDRSITLRTGYRMTDNIFFELAYTKISGVFSSSTLYQANIYMQLYTDKPVTPIFLIGYGKFENVPASTLVSASSRTLDMGNAGIGVKYYLSDRFYFRFDATTYVVLVGDDRADEYTHIHGGFSFFF